MLVGLGPRTPDAASRPPVVNRWVQLAAGIVAMMAIANLQYAWTLFTTPLTENLNTTLDMVQWAFAGFILAETWLVPFEGYMVDKLGPRVMLSIGGVLVGAGWVGAGRATSIEELIALYTLGGVGAGVVYGGTIGNALKWFPDHRGLCVGLTSGAYGVGTALTVWPISRMIETSGYQQTLIVWGIIQGIVVVVAAFFMASPPEGWLPAGWNPQDTKARVRTSGIDMTPKQMLRTSSFWIIYVMMTMLAFGGLVVTAQLNPIARSYGVDKVIVLFGMSALVLAIEVDRILNGITRPFWGWVSDRIGRENTMFIAFNLEAVAVFLLLQFIDRPILFILLSGLCFFAWGEIFSLFPAITGDLFGRTWATTNYGIVYTAKGTAAILAGPVAAAVGLSSFGWEPVFWAMITCDLVAAFMALFWLKPTAARIIARAQMGVESVSVPAVSPLAQKAREPAGGD
ncbi:MAG: oxalate/formate MFS antiporter [Terriglobia bacterium]